MTSLLFRFGTELETRLASQSLWSLGKRKRGGWVCAECRGRGALRQRRAYGDDTASAPSPFTYRDSFSVRSQGRIDASGANGYGAPAQPARLERQKAQTPKWGFAEPEDMENEEDVEYDDANVAASSTTEAEQAKLWEHFERSAEAPEDEGGATDREDELPVSRNRYEVMDIDYHTHFAKALTDSNPDIVARCLVVAERKNDVHFIRCISPSTFSECIRLLQPANLIERLASTHVELSNGMARQMGLAPMRSVAWEYGQLLLEILAIRRTAGILPGLDDYRELLRAARDLGSKFIANVLWRHMQNQGLTPDTTCWNYKMAARIFNRRHDARSRQTVRVTGFHQLARRQEKLGIPYHNYRVGDNGVKVRTMGTLSEMLQTGAIADEETFRNVILATAREGDIATAKGVLKKVWDVDVDALTAGNVIESPKEIERSSPLYPTSELLFTIAHAFGINNDIPAALRTVAYVARRYDLDIDLPTWNQLFEWTFVLATPRTGQNTQADGSRKGQLPKQSVLSLWQTMTGPPYNVQPTMGMYNHLIKNLSLREMPFLIRKMMEEGRRLSANERQRRDEAWARLQRRLATPADALSGEELSPEALRREWEYRSVICKRDDFWLNRWIRMLLMNTPRRVSVDVDGNCLLRLVPSLLWEWREWASDFIRYDVPGGRVEFSFRTAEERAARSAKEERQWRAQAEVLEQVPLAVGEWWVRSREPLAEHAAVRKLPS